MSVRNLLLVWLAPLGGCWWAYPGCGGDGASCPRPEPVEDGLYVVEGDGRDDMVSGDLEVAGDQVFVTYVDDQGHTWEVAYAVVDRVPNRTQ